MLRNQASACRALRRRVQGYANVSWRSHGRGWNVAWVGRMWRARWSFRIFAVARRSPWARVRRGAPTRGEVRATAPTGVFYEGAGGTKKFSRDPAIYVESSVLPQQRRAQRGEHVAQRKKAARCATREREGGRARKVDARKAVRGSATRPGIRCRQRLRYRWCSYRCYAAKRW